LLATPSHTHQQGTAPRNGGEDRRAGMTIVKSRHSSKTLSLETWRRRQESWYGNS
jgi:hypothetical protein